MKMVSPSRKYVAMCNKSNFDGFYFLKFDLPEKTQALCAMPDVELENDADSAAWFFLNRLNFEACLQECFPLENLGEAGKHIPRQLTWKERNKVADAAVAAEAAGGKWFETYNRITKELQAQEEESNA